MSLLQTDYTDAPPTAPNAMIIFGAGGDLTKRKLIPALFHLCNARLLPDSFAVLGLDRLDMDDDGFREMMADEIGEHVGKVFDQQVWNRLLERIHYMKIDMLEGADYQRLGKRLSEIDAVRGTEGNYLFYMAIPPSLFGRVTDNLGEIGLLKETEDDWRRVIIEKPFGRDLESAVALNCALHKNMGEDQIYRIDHYLGKETVQNIMVFRFANGFIEPLWNRQHIDHVQMTVAESVGVEHRGAYYEEAGALRDMIPNHLLVLLGFVAMEPPNSFEARALRDEVNKVLDAIEPLTPEQVLTHAVRGQYGEGVTCDGEQVMAYRSSPDVDPKSGTETFAALKLRMDNWRWAGVPFYLRTGKRLTAQYTEIAIQFKRAPTIMFKDTDVEQLQPGHAGAANPAQRGHPDELRRQGAGAGHAGGHGEYGLLLRGLLRQQTGHRLRDPDLRLHERGRDALQARGHGREGLGDRAVGHGCLVGAATAGLSQLRGRDLGSQSRGRSAQERQPPVA